MSFGACFDLRIIYHRAPAGVFQVSVAHPCCVFPVGAGMDFPTEGIPAFAADNLAGKGIALLVLSISLLDAFLTCPLFNQGCCGFKILMAYNCFVVIWHIAELIGSIQEAFLNTPLVIFGNRSGFAFGHRALD